MAMYKKPVGKKTGAGSMGKGAGSMSGKEDKETMMKQMMMKKMMAKKRGATKQ